MDKQASGALGDAEHQGPPAAPPRPLPRRQISKPENEKEKENSCNINVAKNTLNNLSPLVEDNKNNSRHSNPQTDLDEEDEAPQYYNKPPRRKPPLPPPSASPHESSAISSSPSNQSNIDSPDYVAPSSSPSKGSKTLNRPVSNVETGRRVQTGTPSPTKSINGQLGFMRGHDGSVSEPGSPSDLGPDGKHRTPSWFWDEFSRQEAEEKLRNLPDGSFLVRNSSTPGTYTLTVSFEDNKKGILVFYNVRQDGKSKHLRIFSQDGMYGLKQDECKFESLSALVKYYTKHSLAEFSRKVTTHLLHPVRKAQVTKVNIEDALYILAEKGRQLNKDKEKYIELFKKQENANNTLLLAQMEAQALDNVRSMYEEFLNFPEQTDDVQEDIDKLDDENKKILRENGELAMRRHMTYMKEANEAVKKVKKQEEIQQQSVHDITSYFSVLMDTEEQCGNIREQLLACCVKPELLDCLLVEKESVPEWPQSSWLVNCSREAAEATLADMDVGSFLLRKRNDLKEPYALSIVCSGEDDSQEAKPLETKPPVVKHCVIHHPPEKGYGFRADCAVFESIDELVSKHSQTTMKVYFSHMDTCLLHPAFLEKPAK